MSPTRRDVLKLGILAGTGLVLELLPGGRWLAMDAAAAAAVLAGDRLAPNPWLAIGADGRVAISVARGEMGQGVRTALPMIVADELDIDWRNVDVVNAAPGPNYTEMRTSGSFSVGGAWTPLRAAGAAARTMLIGAAAAQWKVPVSECVTSAGEVIHSASNRRLGYGALTASAAAQPVPDAPAVKDASAWRLIGRATPRVDGNDIVTGQARYGLDVRRNGMLRAVVARPASFGARLGSWDGTAARKVAGVRAVVAVPSGVAVVAEATWPAIQGRNALTITWEPGSGAAFDSERFRTELAEASRGPGIVAREAGDAPAALAAAPHRIDALYEYGFQVHAPLEPMNAVAQLGADGCDVWVGTQAANQVHEAVAERLGIPLERVRIHPQLMGGGFGRRLGVDVALEAIEVARAPGIEGLPVQVVWTRDDDMRHGFFQPASAHRMSGAVDGAGRPVAWSHTMAGVALTALRTPDPEGPELARDLMWGGFDNPYRFAALRVAHVLRTIPVPTGPWRAVHYPSGVLARECFLDELAHAAKVDPLRFRLGLLEGAPPDSPRHRLARVLQLAADRAGWGRPLATGRGLGLAGNIYHGETVMAHIVEASADRAGKVTVHRVVCAVDCGTVVNPLGLEGQIESAIVWGLTAALKSEIVFREGAAVQSGFIDYPMLELAEMPVIETHIIPGDRPPLGIGEQPVAPVAAAVHNALFAATGTRVRRSPVRPEDLI